MIGNIKRSPRFIKAPSESALQKAILEMQIKTGKEYSFFSIYPVKGGVVAWYLDSSDSISELLRILKNG